MRKALCLVHKRPQVLGLEKHFVIHSFSLLWKAIINHRPIPRWEGHPCTQSYISVVFSALSPRTCYTLVARHPFNMKLNLWLIIWWFVRSRVLTPLSMKSTIILAVTSGRLILEEAWSKWNCKITLPTFIQKMEAMSVNVYQVVWLTIPENNTAYSFDNLILC